MRQPLLVLALALSAGVGTASPAGALAASATKNAPPPPPRYSNPTNTAAPQPPLPNTVSGAAIVQSALKYLGYRYTITGTSPSTGFSCIGLISYVYRQNGITLPGDLQNALNYAPAVPFSQLLPGDILYFQNTIWTGLSHAGIYLGGGKFVHAEWYNRGVVVSSFNDDPVDGNYWTKKYLGANRPWMGVAVGPVIPPVSAAPGPSAALTAPSVVVMVAGAPPALVTQSLLNVRLSPSMNARVQQVIRLGASLTVIGQRNGWYKVQLTDGTIGWVIAQGISNRSRSSSTERESDGRHCVSADSTGPSDAIAVWHPCHGKSQWPTGTLGSCNWCASGKFLVARPTCGRLGSEQRLGQGPAR